MFKRSPNSATSLVFLAYLIMSSSPSVPSSLHYLFIVIYNGFTTMMACRVFRGVALGRIEDSSAQLGITSTRIAAAMQLEPLPPSSGDAHSRHLSDAG